MNDHGIPLGLSFDDVLLIPQGSSITSRKQVSTRSRLVRDIYLDVPIISANMDTVTEAKMNILMSSLGGIGFIHRFLDIESQVKEVVKVKRYMAHVIENPYEITPDKSIENAYEMMDEHNIGGLMVVDGDGRLIGIITRRDIYSEKLTNTVKSAMTPVENMVVGKPGMSSEKAEKLMHKRRVEKLPLIDKKGRATGLIVMKDIRKLEDYPNSSLDKKGRLLSGAAIGVGEDFMDRTDELIKAGVDVITLDVAHAHAAHVIKATKAVHKKYPDLPLVVGDIATPEAVTELVKAGADTLRAQVGPGSICITRKVAGAGYPTLSTIINCYKEAKKTDTPLISDGGIKIPADFSKAIGAGANAIIIGSLLSGTEETPGDVVIRDGQKMKHYRGMASNAAMLSNRKSQKLEDPTKGLPAAEGVETLVPARESAESVITELVGGLKSGMSYSDSTSIDEFHKKAKFVQMTAGGAYESGAHIFTKGQ